MAQLGAVLGVFKGGMPWLRWRMLYAADMLVTASYRSSTFLSARVRPVWSQRSQGLVWVSVSGKCDGVQLLARGGQLRMRVVYPSDGAGIRNSQGRLGCSAVELTKVALACALCVLMVDQPLLEASVVK
ncbi:MAG: hypothetical protein ACREIC_31140, partial [Limisphaerales bacterium]